METERKEYSCELDDLIFTLDGLDIDEAIDTLQLYKEKFKNYTDLRLESDERFEGSSLRLYGNRFETDEELSKRQLKEIEEYERLKSKYGKP